jgi:hypothetical protein
MAGRLQARDKASKLLTACQRFPSKQIVARDPQSRAEGRAP